MLMISIAVPVTLTEITEKVKVLFMKYIFAIVILLGFLGSVAAAIGIPIIVLIGILIVIAAIAATIYVLFSKSCGEEEVTENGKKVTKKLTFTERLKSYWGVLLITGIVILFAVIILMDGGGSSNSNGRYGRGEQYDKDVYEAADAFGEDPDHVNDVYEALADEMR